MCGILGIVHGCPDIEQTRTHCTARQPVGAAGQSGMLRLGVDDFVTGLRARGPDQIGVLEAVVVPSSGNCSVHLHLAASLLQLRGHLRGSVPLSDSAGNILLFNGEVFGGVHVPTGSSDSAALLEALTTSVTPDVLNSLRGPWSLLFWHASSSVLWFGRDVMGRRSLLVHWPDDLDDQLLLSSVAPLPATSTYVNSTTSAAPAAWGTHCEANGNTDQCGVGHKVDFWNAGESVASSASIAQSLDCSNTDAAAASCVPWTTAHAASAATAPSGFWQELTPGIYSLDLGQGAGGAHSTIARNLEDSQTSPISAAPLQSMCAVQHHTWTDPLLVTLAQYMRSADLLQDTVVSDRGTCAADMTISSMQAGHQCDQHTALSLLESPQVQQHTKQHRQHNKMKQQAQLSRHQHQLVPACVPAPDGEGAVRIAAQALLKALAAAVELRCRCIDELTPTLPPAGMCHTMPSVQLPAATPTGSDAASASVMCAAQMGSPAGSLPGLGQPFLTSPQDCPATATCSMQPPQKLPSISHLTVPAAPPLGTLSGPASAPARAALLFSGGVDSMLIAALMHRCLPPHEAIELSNVCFDGGKSPDRLAAVAGLEELDAMVGAGARAWRLVQVDSSLAEVDVHRPHLLALLHPADTVMDLNIGAALWLAAGVSGRLRLPASQSSYDSGLHTCNNTCSSSNVGSSGHHHHDMQNTSTPDVGTYSSSAKVVLLGHGADEQCAGYGRHRTAYRASGLEGLHKELQVDMRRMWVRNLGRDDRLVADRGREGRHPFLDETVMELLLSCKLSVLADMRLPAGTGDKQVLREALHLLGLPEAARREKRAIQFGSRIGKLANLRDYGSTRAAGGGAGARTLAGVAAEVLLGPGGPGTSAAEHCHMNVRR